MTMDPIHELLLRNRAWAEEKSRSNQNFFSQLATGQAPTYLWIGCSDSRVDNNEITSSKSGKIFAHRNIANLIYESDLNLMSVITYAVNVLNVEHIVVCGHYECGGVKAALDEKADGVIDVWLQQVRDIKNKNLETLQSLTSYQKKFDKLVELVVQEQAQKLAKLSLIQNAWQQRKSPEIHGLVFNIRDGLLSELVTITPQEQVATKEYLSAQV